MIDDKEWGEKTLEAVLDYKKIYNDIVIYKLNNRPGNNDVYAGRVFPDGVYEITKNWRTD